MTDAYTAFKETDACTRCHEGESWTVKGPDEVCIGQSWQGDDAECEAEETAQMLWQAERVMNLDLLSGLTPEEVCERSESELCEKCGARQDQGCQLEEPHGPSITERAYGEMWGRWAEGIMEQLGDD